MLQEHALATQVTEGDDHASWAIYLLVDGGKAPPAQVVRFRTMHV